MGDLFAFGWRDLRTGGWQTDGWRTDRQTDGQTGRQSRAQRLRKRIGGRSISRTLSLTLHAQSRPVRQLCHLLQRPQSTKHELRCKRQASRLGRNLIGAYCSLKCTLCTLALKQIWRQCVIVMLTDVWCVQKWQEVGGGFRELGGCWES